jgi:hypothetical protein
VLEEVVSDFLTCPGAFAEFPLSLPARAEPVNAVIPSANTSMLVRAAVRFVISFSPRVER